MTSSFIIQTPSGISESRYQPPAQPLHSKRKPPPTETKSIYANSFDREPMILPNKTFKPIPRPNAIKNRLEHTHNMMENNMKYNQKYPVYHGVSTNVPKSNILVMQATQDAIQHQAQRMKSVADLEMLDFGRNTNVPGVRKNSTVRPGRITNMSENEYLSYHSTKANALKSNQNPFNPFDTSTNNNNLIVDSHHLNNNINVSTHSSNNMTSQNSKVLTVQHQPTTNNQITISNQDRQMLTSKGNQQIMQMQYQTSLNNSQITPSNIFSTHAGNQQLMQTQYQTIQNNNQTNPSNVFSTQSQNVLPNTRMKFEYPSSFLDNQFISTNPNNYQMSNTTYQNPNSTPNIRTQSDFVYSGAQSNGHIVNSTEHGYRKHNVNHDPSSFLTTQNDQHMVNRNYKNNTNMSQHSTLPTPTTISPHMNIIPTFFKKCQRMFFGKSQQFSQQNDHLLIRSHNNANNHLKANYNYIPQIHTPSSIPLLKSIKKNNTNTRKVQFSEVVDYKKNTNPTIIS